MVGTEERDGVSQSAGALPAWSLKFQAFVRCRLFEQFGLAVIVLNTLCLIAQTYSESFRGDMAWILPVLNAFDAAFLIYFVIEIALRILADRRRFLDDGWNVFDFVVVALSLVAHHPAVSALRALRSLRVLRLVARMKTLRLLLSVMLEAIPACSSILLVSVLVVSIYAIVGSELFGATNPDLFGTFTASLMSLFRVTSLYDYDGVALPVLQFYPWAHLYFLPFFLIMSLVLMNFFGAILVYIVYDVSLDELRAGERKAEGEEEVPVVDLPDPSTLLIAEVAALRLDIAALREKLL